MAELAAVGRRAGRAWRAVLVVGRGSNLLVADDGFPGVAFVLGEAFADVEVDGTTVAAGAAAPCPSWPAAAVAAGLTGFEWAVGVPGSVGGAVRMNAGGHGSDMAAVLRRGPRRRPAAPGRMGGCPRPHSQLGYRRSSLGPAPGRGERPSSR